MHHHGFLKCYAQHGVTEKGLLSSMASPWRSSTNLMAKLFITHGHQHLELNYTCTVHPLWPSSDLLLHPPVPEYRSTETLRQSVPALAVALP